MINTKSQATIFMIVGLLIIAGGVVFFYSTKEIGRLEPEIRIVQEQVPIEFDTVKSYANECVYSVAVEGLKIIGKQGGYISLTNKTLNKEAFTISQNPTESDAVVFARNSDLMIPYWWYLKSANSCKKDCKFASKRPELRQSENSIEKQLERYIDSNFKVCLNNFEPFVEQGFAIIEQGKIKSDVTIASEDILVIVEFPLGVQKDGTKQDLSQFIARVPINLERIYELATKITNLQIKHHFIEKHVINLIASFSGIDKEKLPPMSDMQFKFGSSISWQKSDIKDKLTSMLSAYIPLFQVLGTYNYDRNLFNSELKQSLYDSTILPVANESFSDLTASFTYLDFWPMYFDLNCNGERCVPSSANSLLSLPFGIQTYRFAYDLSFPVLVEIQDPFALNEQGYSFNLFLEGNIRNNAHIEGDFVQLETLELSESSQLCDIRTSSNVAINVLDTATKKPIEDAHVLYTLASESCFIGSTDLEGNLKDKFPIGIGGVVNFVKENYIGKAVEFDAKLEAEQSLKAELQPIYKKKLVVKKKNVVKTPQGWQFVDSAVDLNEKESATVSLTRIREENELDFSTIAEVQGQQSTEIEIAPGNYAVDTSLLLNERIIIPKKEKCEGIFPIKNCFTTPKMDFSESASIGQEKFPEGGFKSNIKVLANELQNSNTIVLYVISIDIAGIHEQERVIEDSEQIGKIEEYSAKYSSALQPTFEK